MTIAGPAVDDEGYTVADQSKTYRPVASNPVRTLRTTPGKGPMFKALDVSSDVEEAVTHEVSNDYTGKDAPSKRTRKRRRHESRRKTRSTSTPRPTKDTEEEEEPDAGLVSSDDERPETVDRLNEHCRCFLNWRSNPTYIVNEDEDDDDVDDAHGWVRMLAAKVKEGPPVGEVTGLGTLPRATSTAYDLLNIAAHSKFVPPGSTKVITGTACDDSACMAEICVATGRDKEKDREREGQKAKDHDLPETHEEKNDADLCLGAGNAREIFESPHTSREWKLRDAKSERKETKVSGYDDEPLYPERQNVSKILKNERIDERIDEPRGKISEGKSVQKQVTENTSIYPEPPRPNWERIRRQPPERRPQITTITRCCTTNGKTCQERRSILPLPRRAATARAATEIKRREDYHQVGQNASNILGNAGASGTRKAEMLKHTILHPTRKAEMTKNAILHPDKNATRKVMGLKVIEPHGINAVADEEWVEVDVKIDSGATETVIPEAMLEGVIDIGEGIAFKRGVQYEVANGSQIPNLGERRFVGFTEDGAANNIVAQVCAVNQGLMSVRQMTKKGNRVVFDDTGSYIEDKTTGARTWVHDEGGMYSLKMWVSRRSTADAGF